MPLIDDNVKELCVACRTGHKTRVIKLIAQGVDVNGRNYEGEYPAYCAAKHNKPDCLQLLLEAGADLIAHRYDIGASVFQLALRSSDLKLLEVLAEFGFGRQENTPTGCLPLLTLAIVENNSHALDILLKNGADPFLKDDEGRSVFSIALNQAIKDSRRHFDCLDVLWNLKAVAFDEITQQNEKGYTAANLATHKNLLDLSDWLFEREGLIAEIKALESITTLPSIPPTTEQPSRAARSRL